MFVISLLALASSPAAPVPKDAAAKAQVALQGTWTLIAGEEKGRKLSDDEVKTEKLSITIKGNEMTWSHGVSTPERYSFTLDPAKSPAHIDLTELGDTARTGVKHAIYSLEKGELKICFGPNRGPNKPEERPQEFATGESEKRPPKGKIMFTFKQEKK